MSDWGLTAGFVMYVSTVLFLVGGLVLLGFTVAGVSGRGQQFTRLVVFVVWVSAFLALAGALGVIFG